VLSKTFKYEEEDFDVEVCWNHVALNKESIEAKYPGLFETVASAISSQEYANVAKTIKEQGKLTISVEGKDVELVKDQDVHIFTRENVIA